MLAGWWSRVGAALLDGVFAALLLAVVFGLLIACDAVGGAVDTVGTVVFGIGLVLVYFGYAAYLMRRPGANNGRTWGKQVMGIGVVRDNGEEFGLGSALARELLVKELLFGLIGALTFYVLYLLDSLWPLWDDSNRALHDMMVKTHVIKA